MNQFPTAVSLPLPVSSLPERSFLAVCNGSPHDETLLRYAARWVDPAEQHSSQAAGPAARTLPVQELLVSAPRAVQTYRLPPGHRTAPDDLLQRANADGSDALIVGERSLARDLVRRAPCSVWYVPEGAEPAPRRLLVPVDFSLPAADSLRVAAILARLCGAVECFVLHVYFDDAYLAGTWGQQAARRSVATAFDRFLKPIDVLGVRITPCFEEALDVPQTIAEVAIAHQADLIVLSARGRSRPAALLQPTVADQALLTTRVPLLAVKHFGATRSLLSVLAERLRTPPTGLRCN